MAERATAASTQAAAVGDQKYVTALNILNTDIRRAKGSQSKAAGEAGQAYKRIENLGVNKKGATFIASLLNAERAIAEDVMRSVINLAAAAGIMPQEDLVDMAERMNGETVAARHAITESARSTDDDDDDDGEGDDDTDAGDADQQQAGGANPDADLADEDDTPPVDAAPVIHDTDQGEWDAAGEAAAAKQKVGERLSPKERREQRKRSVPTATGPALH